MNGVISQIIQSLCESVPDKAYAVIDHPIDFAVEPFKAIYRDYTPVMVMRLGWCNERGTGGRSRKAVVHARCDRPIAKLQKGELLCGYKSRAKYGGDLYSVDQEVDCPKCRQLVYGLDQTMMLSSNYGWFS